jgi:hypothetical protein
MTEEMIPFRIVAEEMAQAKYMIERPTLRDQFAMVALIAAMNKVGGLNPAIHAENAYFIADAMLEARKEKK